MQSEQLPEVVYTSTASVRQPRLFIRRLKTDLLASRELAWRLLLRNLRTQYRQSLLGYAWVFLPPLFTTLLWILLNNSRILAVGETEIPYPLYVLVGTLLWQGFVDALNSPLQQLTASKAIVARVKVPWEALILAGMGEVLFTFSIRFVLFLLAFLGFGMTVPTSIFLAPLGILALLMFGIALGMVLLPLGLLFQDIQRGLSILIPLWFYATPIVYAPPTGGMAQLLNRFNPVSPLLTTSREMLTTGIPPEMGGFLLVASLTFFLFFSAWFFYRLAAPHLIARLPT